MKWPNLFIVGAARAGTTSLYEYLKGHPDVDMSTVKEPHFFATVHPGAETLLGSIHSRVVSREDEYLGLFPHASTRPILGEASPSYLFDPASPFRIREKVPDAKIVILLREPVDRAYSHYLMDVREGRQSKPFYEALMEDSAAPVKVWGSAHLYVELGLYSEQVGRYLDVFGKNRVRVYLYDDLATNTSGVVRQVCDFIGIDYLGGRFFDPSKHFAKHQVPRNELLKHLIKNRALRSIALTAVPRPALKWLRDHVLFISAPKPVMDARAQELLVSIYAPRLSELEDVVKRDLTQWRQALHVAQTSQTHVGGVVGTARH